MFNFLISNKIEINPIQNNTLIDIMKKDINDCFVLGALKKGTNQYVSPLFAKKKDASGKKNEFCCPDCSTDVILRQGKIKIWHFAHRAGSKCGYFDNPSEGAIHKEAKYILANLLDIKKDIFIEKRCSSGYCPFNGYCEPIKITSNEFYKNAIIYNDNKYFNYNGKKIKPDIGVCCKISNELKYIFEIVNTHKTKECDRPEPWCEIFAKKIMEI